MTEKQPTHTKREIAQNNGLSESHGEEQHNLHHFDLYFYQAFYPDLAAGGVTSPKHLSQHYLEYGLTEGRVGNVEQWLLGRGLPVGIFEAVINWTDTLARIRTRHPDINLNDVLDGLLKLESPTFEYFEDANITSSLYRDLGIFNLAKGHQNIAESLLQKAIRINSTNGVALEYLGNIELERGHIADAARYYAHAVDVGHDSKWLMLNLSKAKLRLGQIDAAYEASLRCLRNYPEFTTISDHLDVLAETLWAQTELDITVAILCEQREKLVSRVWQYAEKVYYLYLTYYGVDKPPTYLGDINLERVLIIGDFVVPQCTRYRIEQKVEQLGAAGVDATTINWMEIGDQIDQLPFHDIVIFYRVPAVPRVLKAMAQVAAAGKLAIYEIDDLLFEPIYPPPLHTYGTLVDEQTYAGLMKGMALYNAAVRCCRIGIASTQALVARLGPLTQSGRCILHRNGLDSQNVSRLLDRSFKDTIDIFYGSGTKAHNSDLTEIIVPAMEKTLSKHREARFIVMGYAQLPNSFIDRFGAQVLQITLSNTVRAYYEVLQWADINIAALHTDSMNDCKSELKWFEAACFGIPSVMSPTANYLDIIKNGEDGFIAETTEDWVKTLNNLIIDANLRQSMGVQAHDRVLSEYTPDVLGKDLMVELKRTVQKLQDINRGDLKKPKVAIVNVFLSPQLIGGATRVVQDNLDDFAKYHSDDFDVVLFSSNVDDHPAHRVSVHMDGPRRNYRTTIMHREYMDWHPRDPKLYSLFSDFLAIEKPDIVHFHCLQRLTASVVDAARDANVPYVVTIHDAWWISDHQFMVTPQADVFLEGHPDPFTQSTSASIMTEQKSMERRNYLKSLLLEAKAVTTVSDSYAKIYACNGITRIQTIPNGISGSLDWCKKDTAARERVVIGHIGGMSAHKGFNLLRETVRSLDLNNVEILVVDHSMEELAIRRDRWGNVPVKFIGRVPQFKIVDLYRQIDVLAAPSIWPESFGLVTREAAACGCWVIASNIGGIGEDIIEGKNGFSIKPEPNALAKTLIEIDSNPKRFKLSINIQQIRYSKEQAESLASLYEEITPEFIVRKN